MQKGHCNSNSFDSVHVRLDDLGISKHLAQAR